MKKNLKKVIPILIILLAVIIVCIICFEGIENTNNNYDVKNDTIENEESPLLNPGEEYRIENENTDTIFIEGIEEKIKIKTYISNFNYTLKFDYETFKAERTNGKDKITLINNPNIYILIEPTTKEKCKPDSDTNVYKGNGKTYVKITKVCPDTSEYAEEIGTRIDHMIKSIRFE